MVNHYDIAVIGGGPAGATFARELAKSKPDRKIVLIDEKPRTGSKVCGGLLAPDAQKVLAQFKVGLIAVQEMAEAATKTAEEDKNKGKE